MIKGVVIPYIVALILAIVVLAVLGYWFFVLGGSAPGKGSESFCQAKRDSWCIDLSRQAFDETRTPFGYSCSFSDPQCWEEFAPGCSAFFPAPSVEECKSLLGIPGTSGEEGLPPLPG